MPGQPELISHFHLINYSVHARRAGHALEYRYGDDFKGNVEIMALTVCPDALWFYKFIEGKVKKI